MLKLRLELLAGLLVSSQISTKIWLSIIDGGNNGNVECSSLLAACLPACQRGTTRQPAPATPPSPLPPAATTTRFLFENHFVCFMDLRSLKWLRRFVCLVLLLLKISRREWKVPSPFTSLPSGLLLYMGRASQVFGLGLVFVLFRRVDYWLRVMATGNGEQEWELATGNRQLFTHGRVAAFVLGVLRRFNCQGRWR